MKKIKVIDLLNKIANGEVPEKIKYCNDIYHYNEEEQDYVYFESGIDKNVFLIGDEIICTYNLQEEVEIIEDTPKEDKKIKKLNIGTIVDDELQGVVKSINICNKEIQDKLNEIIDRLNGE